MSLTAVLAPVVAFFEQQGIAYVIGGSVASSIHGSPRATNDIDIAVDLRHEHVGAMCTALAAEFYVSDELLHEAITGRTCANLLHFGTGLKVDLFVQASTAFDQAYLRRAVARPIEPGNRTFPVATAEDILLRKLAWYRAADEVSDRQWSDILGILRVGGASLDRDWIRRWAAELGVGDLLVRAEREAAT